jgi:CubicO group peptidase (beta-lactamase class C family)
MKKHIKPFFLFLATLFLILPSAQSSSPSQCISDFADGVFVSQMMEHKIAGLTFSLISGDSIEVIRSYGYSNAEAGRRVDENTSFKIGSISKLFVWVAVMQLVEDDKLDINKPINDYLTGFRLPESYKPVTMKHLMSHTPGFEEKLLNLFSQSHEDLPDLESYLAENLPLQIFEPGSVFAYSNYGVALAAYVVEQIAGIPFNDYLDENIFGRLGMHQTTFRQPAGFVITENKSRGHVFRQGKLVSPFDEFVIPYPAGSAVSSAHDMIIFMNALLKPEIETEIPLLQEETIKKMFTTLHTPHPLVPGMGYGFFRMQYKGLDLFWHGGDTYFFHSAFVLVPEKNTGIFLSSNTGENGFFYVNQFLHLLDYLFNLDEYPVINRGRSNGFEQYAGRYSVSRRNEGDFTKIFNMFMGVDVKAVPEGLLVAIPGILTELFRPVNGDGLFMAGDNRLIIEKDEKGRVSRAVISHFPVVEMQAMSWREGIVFNVTLLLLALLISVKSIICTFVHFFKKSKAKNQGFKWFMVPAGILIILFFVLFFGRFAGMEQILFPNLKGFKIILTLPLVSLILFILATVAWFNGQIMGKQRLPRTFRQFIAFVILVVFYIQMYFWNLLTIPFI